MAQAFVRQHPPKSPLLFEYGDGFADFVAAFEPAAALAYLPDVIRLEAARSRAYHAADETSIEPAAFAAVLPDDLPGLRLRLHASAFIIRSAHPVVTIWAANAGDADAGPVDHWVAEEAAGNPPPADRLGSPPAARRRDLRRRRSEGRPWGRLRRKRFARRARLRPYGHARVCASGSALHGISHDPVRRRHSVPPFEVADRTETPGIARS